MVNFFVVFLNLPLKKIRNKRIKETFRLEGIACNLRDMEDFLSKRHAVFPCFFSPASLLFVYRFVSYARLFPSFYVTYIANGDCQLEVVSIQELKGLSLLRIMEAKTKETARSPCRKSYSFYDREHLSPGSTYRNRVFYVPSFLPLSPFHSSFCSSLRTLPATISRSPRHWWRLIWKPLLLQRRVLFTTKTPLELKSRLK